MLVDDTGERQPFRVILSYRNQRIRGLVEREHWPLMTCSSATSPLSWFRPLDEAGVEHSGQQPFASEGVKALFVVRSFEGERGHDTIFFHGDGTTPEWLWIKVTFADGEVLEGMTDNDAGFVLDEGFLLYPTDPTGNNLMIYVFKAQMQTCTVLGLRQRFRRAGALPGEESTSTSTAAAD